MIYNIEVRKHESEYGFIFSVVYVDGVEYWTGDKGESWYLRKRDNNGYSIFPYIDDKDLIDRLTCELNKGIPNLKDYK